MAKFSKRQLQVGELIKRNFGTILMERGAYIYGDAFVTVTNVQMSPDMGLAKIYLSVYNAIDKNEVLQLLRQQITMLRQQLAGRIKKHVRRIPRIDVYIDETLDEMYHLNSVFNQLRANNQMGEESE